MKTTTGPPRSDTDPLQLDSETLVRFITSPAGVEIRDRHHFLVRFPQCFLGNELVDRLCSNFGIDRPLAVRTGQRLLAQEFICHVVGEHDFKDEPLFYAVASSLEKASQDVDVSYETLVSLMRSMRANNGIRIGRHRRMMVDYPECFSAKEAVEWLVSHAGHQRPDAIRIGQAMLENNLIRHVFDEMHFEYGRHLYRFV